MLKVKASDEVEAEATKEQNRVIQAQSDEQTGEIIAEREATNAQQNLSIDEQRRTSCRYSNCTNCHN